jgi:hypothetical protein
MRIGRILAAGIAAMTWMHDLVAPAAAAEPATIAVGRFSSGDLTGWKETAFVGRTRYDLATVDGSGLVALRAEAKASASGYCRDIEIDLRRTPVVAWSWRMDRGPSGLDERRKSGDDHPLRLYFVHRAGLFGSASRAMAYVWSIGESAGTAWANPFAGEVMQLAVDSGTAAAGSMQQHARDLRADFRQLSGLDIERIDTVCLMTDSDQSGSDSKGWYGDISFRDKP